MESWALTWYPTNAHFPPRVRTYSRNGIQPLPQPALGSVLPCRVSVRCGCGKAPRAQQRPIERYGNIEYEPLLGSARGRSSIRYGCGRKGHRSFGNYRPRGKSKEPLVPYRWKRGQARSPNCSWHTVTNGPCPKLSSPGGHVSPFVPPRLLSPATTRNSDVRRR